MGRMPVPRLFLIFSGALMPDPKWRNDAVAKVETAVQAKYAGITSGMKLPPGMKLPF